MSEDPLLSISSSTARSRMAEVQESIESVGGQAVKGAVDECYEAWKNSPVAERLKAFLDRELL